MQTLWSAQEKALSLWNVLPLHPQPLPLESFTGYLVRLAHTNRLTSLADLIVLAGIPRLRLISLRKSPDYPVSSDFAGLAQITGHSQEHWSSMTFFPLLQRFGYPVGKHSSRQFLATSLASSLRYCPSCLACGQPPYYSLLWRFLALPGCTEHGQYFLDQCGHCGSLLPLLPSPPLLTTCRKCQGDLRRCQSRSLSDQARLLSHTFTQDLKMLLRPMSQPSPLAQVRIVGKRCMALRQQRDLSITELAQLSGQHPSVLIALEQVPRRRRRASFDDYRRYVSALSCSFSEVFDLTGLQRVLTPLTDEEIFPHIASAIRQLVRTHELVTQQNITNLVGLETATLGKYGFAWPDRYKQMFPRNYDT